MIHRIFFKKKNNNYEFDLDVNIFKRMILKNSFCKKKKK